MSNTAAIYGLESLSHSRQHLDVQHIYTGGGFTAPGVERTRGRRPRHCSTFIIVRCSWRTGRFFLLRGRELNVF